MEMSYIERMELTKLIVPLSVERRVVRANAMRVDGKIKVIVYLSRDIHRPAVLADGFPSLKISYSGHPAVLPGWSETIYQRK